MTTYNVALNFEDGVTRVIQCDDDEKVTDAAFRQKINLPMDCRDGVCGTCKCFAEKGEYELEFYMDESMSDEEAEAGYVLTCQMIPESDCVLRVPASSAICKTAPEAVEGEVLGVDRLSETSFGLRVKMAKSLGFLPGQYVNVTVPGTASHRSYSFSSAPGADEATFLIRNLPGGVMSSYLGDRAQPGDAVTLTGPMGAFYLRPVDRPQLWLAGGTGLAPFLSMLEQVAEQGSDHPITLYYAVTRAADLVELNRVNALAEKIGTVTVITILAAEEDANERKGFVTDHVTAEDLNDGNCDVYLCGPPPMVDAVRAHFAKLGVEPANFYFEKFNPTEAEAVAA
ncbi:MULTISPECIES: benzoate 1,2-dioxygenase electron transfer component BenC [Marivita]|uniref:Ring-hydroxylating dioxygenase ferredoxin reductase family protein n=1 Tax=Marivita cryptomonadis TaxID=505252 RepID=A0A9Q2NZB0_9RHOB|nr:MULTISPECIES: benzoate 1,2-dioxygenase electron transfer component BenC [Marivita]MCR9167423.1 benzoate 1,2-dioxygenase electron transfer component BenC [Paracoccaceae bacterium]MBM2322542.1 ring-hydroxylating dioxygenase ferredoxin reductase family protein [Marivita cryptomonadis]MBM2332124.1 ring-hydroxylating dioxygenase ferredoxin reductase family protein [Marivita cryptomonadis]MBM2341708.1 ring-hydroxylating dioxygenase ferredoxin reductase family protein [Marivita cryptomonadis]MBM23